MTPPQPTHLQPSQLGNKDYWDQIYTTELSNHSHDPTDIGTIWFSDSDAESKILAYLTSPSLSLPLSTTSFLDLGTGNGNMLFRLRDEVHFRGRMVGVDYSAPSVALAQSIAAQKGLRADEVRFERWDVMKEEPGPWARGGDEDEEGFGVVLDKGTFDAVSLSGEVDEGTGRRVCEGYGGRVQGLVRRGGYLLVTSCNWTEAELRGWLEGGELVFWGRIAYPKFAFGGRTGQAISSVCFRRRES